MLKTSFAFALILCALPAAADEADELARTTERAAKYLGLDTITTHTLATLPHNAGFVASCGDDAGLFEVDLHAIAVAVAKTRFPAYLEWLSGERDRFRETIESEMLRAYHGAASQTWSDCSITEIVEREDASVRNSIRALLYAHQH